MPLSPDAGRIDEALLGGSITMLGTNLDRTGRAPRACTRWPFLSTLIALGLGLGTSACSSGGSGGSQQAASATLRLEATDAPFDHAMVERAEIVFDRILVHRRADGESGFDTLYEGAPVRIGLAALRNGLTRGLASGAFEPGTYRQLRLRLVDGYLKLKNGREFQTSDGTLEIGKQDQKGFKIFLDPGVTLTDGADETVLLDFDLTKTFVPVPANDPENARLFRLRPLIRAAVRSESGDVRGIVKIDDRPAPDAVLHILSPGEVDTSQSLATTATDADGSAAILGLEDGAYDLITVFEGRASEPQPIEVTAGETTLFEVALD